MKRILLTVLVFIILSGFFITCQVLKPTYFNKRIQFNLTGVLADSSADIIPLNSMKAIASGDKITITGTGTNARFEEVSMVVVKKPPTPPPGCQGCDELRLTYLGGNYFKVFNPKDKVSLTFKARSVPSKFANTINALNNKQINLMRE